MSATHASPSQPAPGTPSRFDVSGTQRVPFQRLVAVELRKIADTRSGRWLLAAILALTLIFMGIYLFAADPGDRVFGAFLAIASTPQGFLLPVLGILLVTSEWSQRTAMVTFALEPSRGRVVAAKTVSALIWGASAFLAAIVIAALVHRARRRRRRLRRRDLVGLRALPGPPAAQRAPGPGLRHDPAQHTGRDRGVLRAAHRLDHRLQPRPGPDRPRAVARPRHRPGSRSSAVRRGLEARSR